MGESSEMFSWNDWSALPRYVLDSDPIVPVIRGLESEPAIPHFKPDRSSSEEKMLDPAIWGQLPQEILLKVVEEHLPLPPLCRFRCVCKAWRTPKLSLAAPHSESFYMCIRFHLDTTLHLYNKAAEKLYVIGESYDAGGKWYSPLSSPCINGFFGLASRGSDDIVVSDLFLKSLTPLPPRPVRKEGKTVFVAMGSNSRGGGSTRLGVELNLDDYFFLVAMARRSEELFGDGESPWYKDLILQVFSGGQWCTSSGISFPAGYTLIAEEDPSWYQSLMVLHGSVFYFLVRSLDCNSVRLCYLDVLNGGRQPECKMVEWSSAENVVFGGLNRISLGVCFGNIFLVSSVMEPARNLWSVQVRMLVGQELELFSHSFLDRRANQIRCGGNELLYITEFLRSPGVENYNLEYNVVANKWEKVPKAMEFRLQWPVCWM